MDIKIKNRDGVKLLTGGKYCEEDLNIVFDDNLFDYAIEDGLVTGTLTHYSNPRVTDKFRFAVLKGTNIEYIDLPNFTGTIGTTGLQDSKKLIGINIPKVTTVNDQAFYRCIALESINLPSVQKIGSSAFQGCTALKSVYIGNMGAYYNLSPSLFAGCYSLVKFVISYTGRVITLSGLFSGWYHFDGTVDATYNPEGLKDGLIYVPDELLESYKSATNWSNYADQIKPLSELPEEE